MASQLKTKKTLPLCTKDYTPALREYLNLDILSLYFWWIIKTAIGQKFSLLLTNYWKVFIYFFLFLLRYAKYSVEIDVEIKSTVKLPLFEFENVFHGFFFDRWYLQMVFKLQNHLYEKI